MAIATAFDGPIPGQSLTTEPRNNPWEQPAQMSTVEEATVYYIERLANQEVLDDLGALCDAGVPLAPLVESTYMQGVVRGLHTIDTGLLVAPIMHTFLKQALGSMGITVKDEGGDPTKRAEDKEMERFRLLAMKYLNEAGNDMSDPGQQMISDMVEQEEPMEDMVEQEEPMEDMAQDKPMGLMAKG